MHALITETKFPLDTELLFARGLEHPFPDVAIVSRLQMLLLSPIPPLRVDRITDILDRRQGQQISDTDATRSGRLPHHTEERPSV